MVKTLGWAIMPTWFSVFPPLDLNMNHKYLHTLWSISMSIYVSLLQNFILLPDTWTSCDPPPNKLSQSLKGSKTLVLIRSPFNSPVLCFWWERLCKKYLFEKLLQRIKTTSSLSFYSYSGSILGETMLGDLVSKVPLESKLWNVYNPFVHWPQLMYPLSWKDAHFWMGQRAGAGNADDTEKLPCLHSIWSDICLSYKCSVESLENHNRKVCFKVLKKIHDLCSRELCTFQIRGHN